MNKINLIIGTLLLALSISAFAREPLDTQITSGGLDVHLLKASVRHQVLTVTVMVENPSDERVKIDTFNPEEVQYVADEKRYPVLKDAEDNWMLSPFGQDKLFYKHVFHNSITFDKKQKIVGWMKFEAPADDAWPIELSLPQTAPFLIEKPE